MSCVNVPVNKSLADTAALTAWLENLKTDLTSGKIECFSLSFSKEQNIITGSVNIPTPTDLTVEIE